MHNLLKEIVSHILDTRSKYYYGIDLGMLMSLV
jgi:hypothetical protein